MKHSISILLVLLLLPTAGCGREVVTDDRAAGETTAAGTTASGAAPESLQGVTDSYSLAHEEIEREGGEQKAGEYEVGYIVEPAEGWWEGGPGDLEWRAPASGETNHIEILPFDSETGLLIPYMDITLAVLDESGKVVEEKPLSFYYSDFYHYADNFSLPKSGTYTLRAKLNPPTFRRHGEQDGEGEVFTSPTIAQFSDVQISTEEEE